jgi:hypothetical protein
MGQSVPSFQEQFEQFTTATAGTLNVRSAYPAAQCGNQETEVQPKQKEFIRNHESQRVGEMSYLEICESRIRNNPLHQVAYYEV